MRQVRQLVQRIDNDGDADLGAMTTDFQVKIVAEQVADAKAKGAEFLTGGDWDGDSRMIPPMVVDKVSDDMALVREETFGPMIPLLPFDSEEEVIRRANDSEYGLTASVWTKDLERAKRVSRALEVGGVSINNVMATEANPGAALRRRQAQRLRSLQGRARAARVLQRQVGAGRQGQRQDRSELVPVHAGEVPAVHRSDRQPLRRARPEAPRQVRALGA